jgi:hypothetical protein
MTLRNRSELTRPSPCKVDYVVSATFATDICIAGRERVSASLIRMRDLSFSDDDAMRESTDGDQALEHGRYRCSVEVAEYVGLTARSRRKALADAVTAWMMTTRPPA